jgi:hypothetical protein
MQSRECIKTVTHTVELLNFVQDRTRIHGVRGFLESLREETSDAMLSSGDLKEGKVETSS